MLPPPLPWGAKNAMLWMGEMYQGKKNRKRPQQGDPVKTALDWWNKAAENGEARGLYQHRTSCTCMLLFQGAEASSEPSNTARKTAMTYYQKASDAGDFKAARYMGLSYQDGVGVEKDEAKAYEYFSLAAQRGDSTGTVYAADYLLEGRGIAQDVEKAIIHVPADCRYEGTRYYRLCL